MSHVAWILAASDLGIEVTAPFIERDRYGAPLEFVAHIRKFGTSAGTLVWYMPEPLPTRRLRFKTAYFVSVLNPTIYEHYDRERFIDLLNGWGWTGLDTPPWWYGGVL